MKDYIPGLEGIPAAHSSISFIDPLKAILEYRGIRIEELAKQSSFEETTFLLVKGRLPNEGELKAFSERLGSARKIPSGLKEVITSFPRGGHPMNALQTGVAALAMYEEPVDLSKAEVREEKAIEIIGKVPTIVAAFNRARNGEDVLDPDASLSHATDFLRMLTGEVPDELSAHVMDVALLLHCDHTMNASTFTARVASSTQADPYAVVASAVGSLSGPLHGGANERVLTMLDRIGSKEMVRPKVTEMIEKREKIMGLGHRVYKTKDPRAKILQELANELFAKKGRSEMYDIAVEVENVATEKLGERGIYPNVDFYSGIVYNKLGIPTDIFTPIFAIARVTGWLSHWLEQMVQNRIFRPTQIYDGEHNVPYVPISER